MKSIAFSLVGLAALAVSGCVKPEAPAAAAIDPASAELAASGRDVAARLCASCHAIDRGAAPSPNPAAPNFADLTARYRMDVLAEELRQGVHVGAPEMPQFQLSVAEVDALVAYIEAQAPAAAP